MRNFRLLAFRRSRVLHCQLHSRNFSSGQLLHSRRHQLWKVTSIFLSGLCAENLFGKQTNRSLQSGWKYKRGFEKCFIRLYLQIWVFIVILDFLQHALQVTVTGILIPSLNLRHVPKCNFKFISQLNTPTKENVQLNIVGSQINCYKRLRTFCWILLDIEIWFGLHFILFPPNQNNYPELLLKVR